MAEFSRQKANTEESMDTSTRKNRGEALTRPCSAETGPSASEAAAGACSVEDLGYTGCSHETGSEVKGRAFATYPSHAGEGGGS